MQVTLTGSHTLWHSPRFRLAMESFSTPDGPVQRPVIHHPGAVAILAQPSPDCVLLVRQYRYPIQRWTLELPAGTREPGEPPEVTAARELAEEAGYAADHLRERCRFLPAPGVSDEELILYQADGLRPASAQPDHGELISGLVVPISELASWRARGALCDAKTIIGLGLIGVQLA